MSGIAELANLVKQGDRRALARAITLVESTRKKHEDEAHQLLDGVMPNTGNSVRVGISGPPGVGKSTLIEAMGLMLIQSGLKVAVLSIDPTSPISKGSLLGDKTRMQRLSKERDAFIRPSPSGGVLGGVALKTREAMLICEAAGFDVIFVETVGIGQSEFDVASMVDVFALLAQPGAGDELQGVKKGVLELADFIVVNKADGELLHAAESTKKEYARALALVRKGAASGHRAHVLAVSAKTGNGMTQLWSALLGLYEHRKENGVLGQKRSAQSIEWFWTAVQRMLLKRLKSDDSIRAMLPDLIEKIERNEMSASLAACEVVGKLLAK